MVFFSGNLPVIKLMKDYLEPKKNRWYARLAIPKDIRHFYKNNKRRHYVSTGTADKTEAQEIAMQMVLQWKREFKEYRALLKEQLALNNVNEDIHVGQTEAFEVANEVKQQLDSATSRDISRNEDIAPWETEEELLKLALRDVVDLEHSQGNISRANAIHSIALSGQTPLQPFTAQWSASLSNVSKTIDQRISDVGLLLERFKTVESITPQSAREWIAYLKTTKQQNGKLRSANSINRILIGARSFWDYLQDVGKAPLDQSPFTVPKYIKKERERVKAESDDRDAYTVEQAVSIYRAAELKGDQQLVDLIHIGMYTGARINEICSLKLEECSETKLNITVSKTKAGIREIPVHKDLKPTIKRLLESSKDGYLISGLSSANKYKNRSECMVSRYSNLKTKLGYGPTYVFHSFRNTIVTELKQNGFEKELIAETVGHLTNNFTIDRYGRGYKFESKSAAINSLIYPW